MNFYKITITVYLLISLFTCCVSHLLDGYYCGKENCYDVLGVTREATKNEIGKYYRQLAKKYHPDLHKGEEAKKIAEEKFKQIALAYEILKDDESRNDYDFLLDNPDAYYANYYRLFRRKAPKVDVKIVLFVTISIISIIQYYVAWQRYDTAIKYFVSVPKYRNHALDIAKEKGMLENKKQAKGKTKTEQKEQQEQVIRKVVEENMDIKGAYAKPSIYDILWVQILVSPYTLYKYFMWYVIWIWNFSICKKPYGAEEKLYIIRKYMKMGHNQFDALDESKKKHYLELELWKKDYFDKWSHDEEEKMKKTLAESARYKQYRRYLKQHGVGRMTFDDS